jgi:hypothetical protein
MAGGVAQFALAMQRARDAANTKTDAERVEIFVASFSQRVKKAAPGLADLIAATAGCEITEFAVFFPNQAPEQGSSV